MLLQINRGKTLVIVSLIIAGGIVVLFLGLGQSLDFFVVVSDSMIPNLNTGDIVIISRDDKECYSFACLKVGDIIVFKPNLSQIEDTDKTIVHRIYKVSFDSDGRKVITTKGDANSHSIAGVDFPVTEEHFIGKVTQVIPYAGLLLMYLNILAQIVLQPIFYILVGSVAVAIYVMEYQKRKE
jgi:signal peptidase I